jgi:hypothetical protein
MPRDTTSNNQAAIQLAKKLFHDAKANGTLKKPGRGLAALLLEMDFAIPSN